MISVYLETIPLIFTDEQLAMLNANSLYQALGIEIHRVADGDAESVLDATPAMCFPTPGRPHGGVIFTVLDTTMAFAAISNGPAGTGCGTVDCNIQYPRVADHGPFRCRVTTTSKTSRTVFTRGELVDRHGHAVALAQATFRLFVPR